MQQLHSKLAVAIFLLLLPGCGEDQREEITERYSTGEKKVVFIYRGQGAEEELIKRQMYARNGELIRVENVAEGDTLRYGDLNPGLAEPDGLRSFLTEGAWVRDGMKPTLQFIALQFTSDSLYDFSKLEGGGVEEARANPVDYLSGGEKASFLPGGNEGELRGGRVVLGKQTDADTVWAYPLGPDSLLWLGLSLYKRADRDVRETVRGHLKEREELRTPTQNITLQPRGEQMKFGHEEFTVPAGKSVKVTFENTATSPSMQHNVLLLNEAPSQSIFKEVGQAGVKAGANEDYVPDHKAVLASTPISKPGETVSVTFRAPSEPGEYGYVCTYPGHWATGQGTMRVVRE